MTSTKLPPRRKWTCDTCGKTAYWDDNWSYYGSIAHVETCPDDLICSCSDKCREIADKKIASGTWRLPELRSSGPAGMYVIKKRVGY